jgi:hypothetical protein
MKILYHAPTLYSIYAQRTIYHGYQNAFKELGHEFRPLTAGDNADQVMEKYRPDIFITSSFHWYQKYLNFNSLKKFRNEGMFTLVKIDFWESPLSRLRINEASSLKNDKSLLKLIESNQYGDAYFHVVEQDDLRMLGFKKNTGIPFHTIPLAADSVALKASFEAKFSSDLAYIGTNLPDKREFFKNNVYPLGEKYDLKLYGQDWSLFDRSLGWIQRGGQYFNIPLIRTLRKPKLRLEDESIIYKSSKVSINVHESYQRQFGGDCNERTFKIPFCGGFQVVDNVSCIKKYFISGEEIVIGETPVDWQEKVHYYMHQKDEREKIARAGQARVLKEHTYLHRALQIIDIVNKKAKAEDKVSGRKV